MTPEQETLAAVRAVVQEQPPLVQARVEKVADAFRQVITTSGSAGLLAFALVGAELAAEAE